VAVTLSARRIAGLLLGAVLVCALASAAGQLSKYVLGHGRLGGLVPLLYVGNPRSLPAWLASAMLLLAALLAAASAAASDPAGRRPWHVLAVVLVLSAADTAVGLHARLARAFGLGPIAGGVVVLGVGLALRGLLQRLSPRARRTLLLGAGLWVLGALGLDAGLALVSTHVRDELARAHQSANGRETPLLALLTSVEGTLGLAGIAVVVHALLLHLGGAVGELRVRITSGGPPAPAPVAPPGPLG
jgi:hypothetical protein